MVSRIPRAIPGPRKIRQKYERKIFMKEFFVDRKYWIPDSVYYDHLNESARSLCYLDDYFVKYYRSSKLDHCEFCGGRLYRRVVSHSAGHGENFISVNYRCFDCPLNIEMSADYGNTFQDADDLYVSYCSQLKAAIKEDDHASD